MPTDLLRSLKARGVILEADADVLRLSAPPGVLTDADRQQIRRHKAALLDLLRPPEEDTAALEQALNLPHPRERLLALGALAGYPTLYDRGYITLLPGEAAYGLAARRRTEEQVWDLVRLLTNHLALGAGEEAASWHATCARSSSRTPANRQPGVPSPATF